ncbi:MAG: hypothetical protein KL785_05995 [Brevundimonas sp.]|nr:hypothetical protein [Brevundimonas sp.]
MHADMLGAAGIDNYSHFQSRVTKRTRTITGNKKAFLFTWDGLVGPSERYREVCRQRGDASFPAHLLQHRETKPRLAKGGPARLPFVSSSGPLGLKGLLHILLYPCESDAEDGALAVDELRVSVAL